MSGILELLSQLLSLSPGLQQRLAALPYEDRMIILLRLGHAVLDALAEDLELESSDAAGDLVAEGIGSLRVARDVEGRIWIGWTG